MLSCLKTIAATMLIVLTATHAGFAETPASEAEPVRLDADRHLFIDDYLIARMDKLKKTLHEPEDYENNPVLISDRPWEHRRIVYGSVYYIAEEEKFKCWYLAIDIYNSRPGSRMYNADRHVPLNESAFVCYAESADGIHWTKPELGIHEYRGSKANNIVLTHKGSHFDSTSVIYTPRDEEKPYKMMVFQGRWPYKDDLIKKQWGADFKFGIKHAAHYAWHSKDGIHFTPFNDGKPVLFASDRSMFWFDPDRKIYVGGAKSSYQKKRAQLYAWSKDCVNWTRTPTWLMRADERDHPRDESESAYGFKYGAQWVGYTEMRRVRNTGAGIDQELMVSRDGRHWTRPIRKPFISFGPKESWRHGVIKVFANPPIERDGQLWMYYGGGTGAVDIVADTEPFQALSLTRLRKDGFVSVDGDAQGGTLVTQPVLPAGKRLHVNANADGGEIRVEIRRVDGKPVPGFTAEKCRPITADLLDATVSWDGVDSLDGLHGSPVRLVFSIKNARLYSIWTDAPSQ